jgi:hypothetical protein
VTMTDAPTKPSQGQQLANVLLKCRAGLALSRTQAEEALNRIAKVEDTLGQIAAIAEKGAKAQA